MKEKDISLFGKICHCFYYQGKGIEFDFDGRKYRNQLVYRPEIKDIPNRLIPTVHQCVRNAYYVSKQYGADVIEGIIIVLNKDGFSVNAHCWNHQKGVYFDVTPFDVIPEDVIYIPYDTKTHDEYKKKFGNNTDKFTFLSGKKILEFEEVIRASLKDE